VARFVAPTSNRHAIWLTTKQTAAALGVCRNTIHRLTCRHDHPLEWKAAGGGAGGAQGVGKLFLRADVELVAAIRERMGCTVPAAIRVFAAFPELREAL
jgi:hypothetical protein